MQLKPRRAWNKSIRRVEEVRQYRAFYTPHGPKRLHVLRAEKALGRPLPPEAVVHHADGSKGDKAPLVICQDQAYHLLLHRRMRIVRAGGNPNTQSICRVCGPQDVAKFSPHQNGYPYPYCRVCRNAGAEAK